MCDAARITSLCLVGFKYTYARDVSMGCITATAAAAEQIPEMAPSAGDPGVSTWLLTNHSLTSDCTVRFTEEPSMSRVTLAPTPR